MYNASIMECLSNITQEVKDAIKETLAKEVGEE